MKTISHRELRNQSAQVLREVASGASYAITNFGSVVARLSPPTGDSELTCVRAATTRPVYSKMPRVKLGRPSLETLDDLRGDR